jgi:hypothetical protein
LYERSRILPIPETDAIVIRPTSEIEDDSQYDKTNDGNHFDRRKDEFRFSIGACSQHVDDNNDNKAYRYPRGIINLLVPIVDKHSGGTKLGR